METSPVYIDSPERRKLIEVSADGIVEHRTGEEPCPFNKEGNRHDRLVVEIKCPMQPANLDLGPHYKLLSYYACQVLSEMTADEVKTCLYVCYTFKIIIVYKVQFDENLWKRILKSSEIVWCT